MTVKGWNIADIQKKTVIRIQNILLDGSIKMVKLARESLVRNKHYVTGNLSNAVYAKQIGLSIEFGNTLEYAKTIETGIVTNAPSVNDIRTWLDKKISLGDMPESSRYAYGKIASNINQSMTIKRWNPFMQPALDEVNAEIKPLLQDAIVQ